MINQAVELLTSATYSTSSETALVNTLGGFETGGCDEAVFYLSCTAVTGTAIAIDVDIVATIGGVDYVLESFTQFSAATTEKKTISNCPRDVKVVYTISDSDSATFQVHVCR